MANALQRFDEAPPLRKARAIDRGLPAGALADLVADPAISMADVARVVGPRRTLDRRLQEGRRLSPEESDRLARLLRILGLAAEIFGDRARAMDWLGSPKRRFEGERPLVLLRSDEGTRLVEETLLQARHGFAA
ncbi:MAG: antitoxin Xre/MbcA/ParS toxin-binding domain-containing protein [Sphingomonadaceae bacterium]